MFWWYIKQGPASGDIGPFYCDGNVAKMVMLAATTSTQGPNAAAGYVAPNATIYKSVNGVWQLVGTGNPFQH